MTLKPLAAWKWVLFDCFNCNCSLAAKGGAEAETVGTGKSILKPQNAQKEQRKEKTRIRSESCDARWTEVSTFSDVINNSSSNARVLVNLEVYFDRKFGYSPNCIFGGDVACHKSRDTNFIELPGRFVFSLTLDFGNV